MPWRSVMAASPHPWHPPPSSSLATDPSTAIELGNPAVGGDGGIDSFIQQLPDLLLRGPLELDRRTVATDGWAGRVRISQHQSGGHVTGEVEDGTAEIIDAVGRDRDSEVPVLFDMIGGGDIFGPEERGLVGKPLRPNPDDTEPQGQPFDALALTELQDSR